MSFPIATLPAILYYEYLLRTASDPLQYTEVYRPAILYTSRGEQPNRYLPLVGLGLRFY